MTELLITGMSGLIGSACRDELQDDYSLSALNRSSVDGVPTLQADLADLDAIRPAFEGKDCVIHLAAKISDSFGYDALMSTNVVGTRNVFEAAALAGVKRVVFASSGATVSGFERIEPYKALIKGRYDDAPVSWPLVDETMATRPGNLYASTKVWGEAIARHYANTWYDAHGMEFICLRIGYVCKEDRPLDARHYSVWLSQRDAVQAIRLSCEAAIDENFETLFLTSENKWSYRDISRARTVLGYTPESRAEDFR